MHTTQVVLDPNDTYWVGKGSVALPQVYCVYYLNRSKQCSVCDSISAADPLLHVIPHLALPSFPLIFLYFALIEAENDQS